MTETLIVPSTSDKVTRYKFLLPQLRSLLDSEYDLIANLANTAAVLRQSFDFFWVGFYLVKGQELVLGPFQGDLACTRIGFGKGVCGTAWETSTTQVVANVETFPGHIACSSLTKSEIVVPIKIGPNIVGVLDVDSTLQNDFDAIDAFYLEEIASMISSKWVVQPEASPSLSSNTAISF